MRTETSSAFGHVFPSPTVVAPRVVALSVLGAAATSGLFWDADVGGNLSIFLTIMLAVILVWQRKPLTALGWVTSAGVLGLAWGFRYRASTWTAAWCAIGLLGLVPSLLLIARDRLRKPEDLFTSAWNAICRQGDAIPESIAAPFGMFRGREERAKRVGLGLFFGLPLALLFATLFIAADEHFASASTRVANALFDSNALAIGMFTTAISGGYLWLSRTLALREPPNVATPPSRAFRHPDFSEPTHFSPAATVRPGLSAITIGTTLGLITLVFAAFVTVNIHDLFGGHSLIREVPTLTYSGHLHVGVGLLCVTCLLAVVAVLLGHALSAGATERPIALRGVEVTLLTLAGATLASCATRLRIYAEAYGLTVLRLGVGALLVGVTLVLLLTIVKSCMGAFPSYWTAQWFTLTAFVTTAAWFDADGTVARNQLQRAESQKINDLYYVATLSSDACSVLTSPAFRAIKIEGAFDDMLKRRNERLGDWRGSRGFPCK